MKIAAIVEARMTSTRLPGKVLLPATGMPMLSHLVRRLHTIETIDEIVLATTTNSTDDLLVDFSKKTGIKCFRRPIMYRDVRNRAASVCSRKRANSLA